jgi:hypothetical protein
MRASGGRQSLHTHTARENRRRVSLFAIAATAAALVVPISIGAQIARPLPAAAAPSSSYQTTILGDTPDAYWRLGERSGSTASDASGHGWNGTIIQPVTLGSGLIVKSLSTHSH